MVALSARTRAFVREYIRDFNAGQAALRAGYARRSGPKLLKRSAVRRAIEAAAGDGIQFEAGRVLGELAAIAFSDVRNYLRVETVKDEDRIALVPFDELTPAQTAAIAEYRHGTGYRGAMLRLRGKREALRALARHVGLDERRATVDPRLLLAEAARVRAKVLRAAGIDPEDAVPPPLED
jgi:hypothetical protein